MAFKCIHHWWHIDRSNLLFTWQLLSLTETNTHTHTHKPTYIQNKIKMEIYISSMDTLNYRRLYKLRENCHFRGTNRINGPVTSAPFNALDSKNVIRMFLCLGHSPLSHITNNRLPSFCLSFWENMLRYAIRASLRQPNYLYVIEFPIEFISEAEKRARTAKDDWKRIHD